MIRSKLNSTVACGAIAALLASWAGAVEAGDAAGPDAPLTAGAVAAPYAAAQSQTDTTPPPSDAAKSQSTTVKEVVVTATGTNISGVKPVGSEAVVMSHDQIVDSGLTNVTQVLETLPQVQATGDPGGAVYREGGTAGYGGNSTQGTAINLRGIGSAATLTLVDGHRLTPSGAALTFTEAIQVPIAAIDRIEVVADGASAIYGSDAVSGVVNYILRKNYNGVEVSGRYTSDYGYDEWGASVTAGHSWSSLGPLGAGNLIFSYDHDERSAMPSSKNALLSQNLTPFGGVDDRMNGNTATPGAPGNIVVGTPGPFGSVGAPYTYYGLPTGANTGLTGADLKSTANLWDSAQYSDYLGQVRRDQFALFLNQDLTPWLSVSYEGFYTHRDTISRGLPTSIENMSANFTLPASSPYYVTGIPGVTAGTPETVQYQFFKDIGAAVTDNPDTNYTNVLGAKLKLGPEWKADFFYTYGHDKTCGICNLGNNIDEAAFQNEINLGNINPLSSQPLSKTEIAKFLGTNVQNAENSINDVVLKLNGPLFKLPGGEVKLGFGGEFEHFEEHVANGANRGPNDAFNWDNIDTNTRNVTSAFAELYVPIIGSENRLPMVKSLVLDVAARFDQYSDFGDTTNPKLGLTWGVNDDLSLRASWGTSFRAPALTDTNPDVFSFDAVFPAANNSGDPKIKNAFPGYTNIMLIGGGNPKLKPETATTWTTGFDYAPSWLRGLKVSGTYYSIEYSNQIVFSPPWQLFLSSPQYRQLYGANIVPINQPSTCVEGNKASYDPKLLPYLNAIHLYGGTTGQECSIQVVLDDRESNLASTFQDGLDFQVRYGRSTSLGYMSVGGAVTRILDNRQTPVQGAGQINVLNQIYYPVSTRARVDFGWMRGSWSGNLFVNYVGSYLNNQTLTINGVRQPFQTVPAWVTVDAGLTYKIPTDAPGWARGVRVALNVQNLFDRDPPVVLQANFMGFDASNANIFGRIVTVQLTKSF